MNISNIFAKMNLLMLQKSKVKSRVLDHLIQFCQKERAKKRSAESILAFFFYLSYSYSI